MTKVWKVLDKSCKSMNIQLRPNAGSGIWLSGLLFLAFLLTILRAPETIQISYEVSTVLLFGIFLQSLEIFFSLTTELGVASKLAVRLIPAFITSTLLGFVLHQEIIFSCITALVVLFVYRLSYFYVMKSLPLSFSLGEGSIVTQGLVIFLYNCYLKLPFMDQSKSLSEDLNLILQIGLLGVFVITIATYVFPVFRKSLLFYILLTSVVATISFIPLHNKPAVTVLINFIFSDLERIIVVGVYTGFLLLAFITVTWQIRKKQQSTTSTRKIFHLLIVMVYVPGLIFQCQFLYVASVVVLAIFIVLELARLIELYPVSEALKTSIEAFIDEKDAGKIAFTPIYLLAGCSIPLWIHNSPCDLTGSSAFEILPLMSGVLAIGIGDAFASIIGSKFGRNKWWKTNKSVEGTIASILAQGIFIYALNMSGFLPLNLRLSAICGVAVIVNSLVEALTDQVDNLVLPILTYIILILK